jgi:hypothetical protein
MDSIKRLIIGNNVMAKLIFNVNVVDLVLFYISNTKVYCYLCIGL